jgi:putative aldouronate transport system permease protein
MLMNNPANYPLQSYLQTVIVNQDPSLMTSNQALFLTQVNDRTNRAAQVVVAALPVLILYPFVQRYFVKGIIVGSVKG